MATFADNSVANFFFHSPWRPKWSQLGALLLSYIGSAFIKQCDSCIAGIRLVYKTMTNHGQESQGDITTWRVLHSTSRFDFLLFLPHGKLLEKYLWIKNKIVKFGLSRGP